MQSQKDKKTNDGRQSTNRKLAIEQQESHKCPMMKSDDDEGNQFLLH